NYQAYIVHSANSTPLDTTADFTFRIFDAPTGGTELWNETQNSVQVVNGILDTRLGVNNPLPADIFYSGNVLWLQVEMGTEVFSPRKPLVSVAQAFHALRADTAEVALNASPAPDTVLFAYHSDSAKHSVYADTADYARNVPSPGNYIQNQHTSVQSPGAFWINDSATVGVTTGQYARLNSTDHAIFGQSSPVSYGWVGSKSDSVGVYGLGYYAGVKGASSNGTTYGELGKRVSGLTSCPVGVYGYTENRGGIGAYAYSKYDIAVEGVSDSGTRVVDLGDTMGVYGKSRADGNFGILGSYSHKAGVFGVSTHKFGVYGYVYGTDTGSAAVVARRDSSSKTWAKLSCYSPSIDRTMPYFGILAAADTLNLNGWAGYFIGPVYVTGGLYTRDLYVSGIKSNLLKLDDGRWVIVQATESPYAEYTLRGRARLVNGEATVRFEDPYPEIISDKVPVDVIITPIGSPTTIYVVKADRHGFTVKAKPGDPDCEFTWMAIGRRKGYENKPDYDAITREVGKKVESTRVR
ncbi:hypothetical protein DRO33_05940, partial [Candidatus Bathyarchaeota archaeon]